MDAQDIDERHAPLCTAHKRDGTRCRCIAVRGKRVCRLHGGHAAAGMANGNYRSGRYSKVLPARLAARYEEARSHPALLSLGEELAVVEALLAERLAALDTGESGAAWRRLQAEMGAFQAALGVGDMAGMDAHFAAMRAVVQRGAQQAAALQDIRGLLATRQQLTGQEVKTLQGLQQMVTVQQQMLLLGAIMSTVTAAVKKHVEGQAGRKVLMDIQTEFTRLATLEEH